MSRAVARIGDTSSHGGYISTSNQDGTVSNPDGTVIAEGIEVAVDGALHVCPIPGHGTTSISTNLDDNWLVNGKNVVLDGSVAGCGASIIATATKTFGDNI